MKLLKLLLFSALFVKEMGFVKHISGNGSTLSFSFKTFYKNTSRKFGGKIRTNSEQGLA